MTILFDLDGTLIDSTEAILESFAYSYEKNAATLPDHEHIKALIGFPLDLMFEKLGVESANIDLFVGSYKEHYRTISTQKTILLPLAKEAVEYASEFARLGVVTTKTARYSEELLEHLGIMRHFEILIGRESVQNPKPHPEPVLKAMQHFQCDNERCWMIGDTSLDILAANSAAIKSVAVTSGYESEEGLRRNASIILKNAFEAVEHIKKHHTSSV